MIKKAFKTIFILSLCLGITIPANAGSVSVSDGSAFITKSEMSYQLNVLSNRMTQLENTLDSKIDKLVASYLTRNGIWSGVNQALLKTSFKYGFGSDTAREGSVYFNIYNAIIQQTSGSLFKIKVVGDTGRNTIIQKCNKSGMIFFNIASGTSVNQDMRTLPISSTTKINLANVRWIYTCNLYYQVQISGSSSWETKFISNCDLYGFGIGCSLQVPSLPIVTVCFFVNKEDKIAINAEQTIISFPTIGNDASSLGLYMSNQQSYKTYVIKDAKIY